MSEIQMPEDGAETWDRDLQRHIGRQLREIRRLRKLTLEQTGELLGVSGQQISRVEQGKNRVTASQLFVLATSFGVRFDWFFQGYRLPEDEIERLSYVVGFAPLTLPENPTADELIELMGRALDTLPPGDVARSVSSWLESLAAEIRQSESNRRRGGDRQSKAPGRR